MAASVSTIPQTAEKRRQVGAEKAAKRAIDQETPQGEASRLLESEHTAGWRGLDANPEKMRELCKIRDVIKSGKACYAAVTRN